MYVCIQHGVWQKKQTPLPPPQSLAIGNRYIPAARTHIIDSVGNSMFKNKTLFFPISIYIYYYVVLPLLLLLLQTWHLCAPSLSDLNRLALRSRWGVDNNYYYYYSEGLCFRAYPPPPP